MSFTPPLVLAPRFTARRKMSRPEVRVIAGWSAVRLVALLCKLPVMLISNAPTVVSAIVPPVVKGPKLKLPRLRVRSTPPVGAKLPPDWLKSVATVRRPAPLNVPPVMLKTAAFSTPLLASVPVPLKVRLPARLEVVPASLSVSEPPLMIR